MTRATKIVATLGPASDQPAVLDRLLAAGVDVVRLNFSHGNVDHHLARAAMVREAAARAGKPVALMADLQGPKIRVGRFASGRVMLQPGAQFVLDAARTEPGDEHAVGLDYKELPRDVRPGDTLLLNDGMIKLGVEDEYYLSRHKDNTVANVDEYDLPADIFATKIRRVLYVESNTEYFPITRYRGRFKFEQYLQDEQEDESDPHYKYLILNNAEEGGYILKTVPAIKVSVTDGLHIWYIREPCELKEESDVIDVPYISWVFRYVMNRVKEKENRLGPQDLQELQVLETAMITSLTEQVQDDDDTVDMDTSTYEEHM